jgi:tRNA(fMet)-specific endonuclease VapC
VAIAYLANTDVCIQVLKKKNPTMAKRFLAHHQMIAVSDVTVFELFSGAENYADKPRRCAVIEEFLALLVVLPLDTQAARIAGAIQGNLSRKGQRIGSYDVLNAGIVLSRNLTLATNNLREFLRVPDLRVEQWV